MQLLNQNVAFPKFINRVQEHFTDFFYSCSSCRFSSILADFPLYSEIIQVNVYLTPDALCVAGWREVSILLEGVWQERGGRRGRTQGWVPGRSYESVFVQMISATTVKM